MSRRRKEPTRDVNGTSTAPADPNIPEPPDHVGWAWTFPDLRSIEVYNGKGVTLTAFRTLRVDHPTADQLRGIAKYVAALRKAHHTVRIVVNGDPDAPIPQELQQG